MNKYLLNYNLVRKGLKKEIKDFLEFNKNNCTTYSNLGDTVKALLRGNLINLTAFIMKLARSNTSRLTAHLKALKKKKKQEEYTQEE